jgi:hypothetical protein
MRPDPKEQPGSVQRVLAGDLRSALVAKFKVDVNPCPKCGSTPLQFKAVSMGRTELFSYQCGNWECEFYVGRAKAWQPTKRYAADVWNVAAVS